MFVGRALAAEMRGGTRSPKPAVRKVFPSLPRPALPPPCPYCRPRAGLPSPKLRARRSSTARRSGCCVSPHRKAPQHRRAPGSARTRAPAKGAAIPLGFSIYNNHHYHHYLYFPYEAQTLPEG